MSRLLKSLRRVLFKAIRYSGLPLLSRELFQRKRVTILLFHDIDPPTAEKAFAFLKKNYNIIPLSAFIRACQTGKAEDLPVKPMVITFDDGHRGNYELLPLIRRMDLPVTIFLCAGIVATNRHFWFTLDHPSLSKKDLKRLPNRDRLACLEAVGFFPEKEYPRPQALDREQIRAMQERIDFQAHTLFHPVLPSCDDAEAWKEISGSKEVLEKDFQLDIEGFAYPNGDYGEREVVLCKKAGYRYALTVDHGLNALSSDLFRLKRISVNEARSMDEMVVKASGLWIFARLRKKQQQSATEWK